MTSKVRFLRSEGIDLYAIFIPNMAMFQLTFTEEKIYSSIYAKHPTSCNEPVGCLC
jgi:hypothetical protein